MSKINPANGIVTSVYITPTVAASLDNRLAVEYYSDLITINTYLNDGKTAGVWYAGMTVYVTKTDSDHPAGLYYLGTDCPEPIGLKTFNNIIKALKSGRVIGSESEDDYTTVLGPWTKLSTGGDISDIGGVFEFKGIAKAVSLDLTTLTISESTWNTSTTSEETVVTGTKSLYGVLYVLDYSLNEYCGLAELTQSGVPDPSNVCYYVNGSNYYLVPASITASAYYFTRTSNNTTLVYLCSGNTESSSTETYMIYDLVTDLTLHLYILGNTPTTGVDVTVYVKETVEGVTLYNPSGLVDIKCSKMVSFFTLYENLAALLTAMATKWSVTTATKASNATTLLANSDNNGHVYLIGDLEYASNASLWVQLGSTGDEWIVIGDDPVTDTDDESSDDESSDDSSDSE